MRCGSTSERKVEEVSRRRNVAEEARRRAHVTFGGVDVVKEESQDA